jgi:hypothetical protein|nr:MAG TPA: Baseplate structural protein [Caudoviricetes sp.]
MPKIERKTQKIFGGNAESDQLAVFGSMITGTPVYNDDIETLQSEAYTEGWQVAVAANEAPFMEEMNGVQYGFSKQLAYLFQQGIAEWDAGTTYYLNSFCQVGGVIYKSKLDENINHSPGDDTEEMYWTPFKAGDGGSGGLEVCDIGMSLYIDETKGLRRWLNGQIVAINQNTQGFLTRLKKIVALYPSLLTTEENWQAAKTLSAFGQVGKFVIQDAEEIQYYAYSSGSTTYLTTSTADSDSVNVYNTEFVLQGTGSISSDVLTYESQTYNRASGSDATQEIEAYVRLPKVVNIQGLIDLQNLGVTVAAGLPNITGQTQHIVSGNGATNASDKGALKTALVESIASGLQEVVMPGRRLLGAITIDDSLSNPIYGNSTTVQPEAIQYPYYIQIATGQETEVNITNEIELNNPFFFGMSNYFKFKPNNLSWLKSAGYDEPKAAHPDYYNWILENVNKGVKGFKGQEGYCFIATDSSGYYWWVSTESPVVGASVYRYDAGVNSMFFDGTVETLTSNGFTFTSIFESSSYTVTRDSSKDTSILHPTAWITDNDFEINTSDETFRLPLKNGTEGMFGGGAVVGNGYGLGLTPDGSNLFMLSKYGGDGNDTNSRPSGPHSAPVPVGGSAGAMGGGYVNIAWGVHPDPAKSGLVVANAGVVPDGWALYYYVGATVQNANLIDAGRMQEQITNINAPSRGYLVQSYVNGRSWYRVYSDGWCEQGGQIIVRVAATNITLLKSYKDNNYNAVGCQANTDTVGYHIINVAAYSATQIQIRQNPVGSPLVNWIAIGYIK